MKIFFILTLIVVVMLWSRNNGEAQPLLLPQKVYDSSQFKYRIDHPDGYTLDDTIPELVIFYKSDVRLRINSGCYDFGLENMVHTAETVQIGGRSALKESYYLDSQLNLERYTLTANEMCFALELSANSRDGWQDLEKLARSFRFN